jgi:hypothetical protein
MDAVSIVTQGDLPKLEHIPYFYSFEETPNEPGSAWK